MVRVRVSEVTKPWGAVVVAVATLANHVIEVRGRAPLRSAVRSPTADRRVLALAAVVVAPWEISAPSFCWPDGTGAETVLTLTWTMDMLGNPSGGRKYRASRAVVGYSGPGAG